MARESRRVSQIAALPLVRRVGGGADVFLVTARGSGRWIIPKGNLVRGLTPREAAAREALEEAGLVGDVARKPFATYVVNKRMQPRVEIAVDVYLLIVRKQVKKWREMDERSVIRCDLKAAASLVDCPRLAGLIKRFGTDFGAVKRRKVLIS